MKYDVIIFDADETLFDFRKSEKVAFKNVMLEFQLDYKEDYHLKIYHTINNAIWKEFEKGLITQEKLKVERFKLLSEQLNIDFDEYDFAKAYMKHLSRASFLFEDSIKVIDELSKDHRLIIMTNGLKSVQDIRIRKSVIAKYFEDIVVSEEVGVNKPDSKIFEHALNNINYTDKKKVLIVGDSLTSDIKGGLNFGIDTCWFNPNKKPNESEIKPTYDISTLLEIKKILSN